MMRKTLLALLTLLVLPGFVWTYSPAEKTVDLEKGFAAPPESARPWVYWFWLNGNITREGITADLEAMRRAGIGGVLIMEVDQGIPLGPVSFMSQQWRELFKHVVSEAHRLGLEVNMNNDAGWNGSGGPWIKPEESMQKVVWSEINLEGPKSYEGTLPQPQTVAGFYRDIAVLAFPTPGDFRIDNIQGKAAYERRGVAPASETALPPEMTIDRRLIDLTAKMDKNGHLAWDVPAGKWTVMRIGHTSTGVMNAPSPESGRGLECDKLSAEGIDAQFAGMMGPLISDNEPLAGKTLIATHIDSWENGSQNWTERMREEFRKRRGYDPLLFLPVLSGRVIDSLEISERFLWDLRQTISELVVDNYAGRLAELAQQHGMRLSIEAYGGPCDDMPYAGRADEPMCEFWIGGAAMETCKEMASAAHTYGKPILGAESFTADDREKWLMHPAAIKALGDQAFCEGVNRFVFHRYALQPWLNYQPGMTMGPWGLHYERTATWWEQSRPWHEYLSRCQYLLRQGLFAADICYLQPEESPQGFMSHSRSGYDFDNISAEAVLTRLSVNKGRLVLPDGMSYKLLALPQTSAMTPRLLRKIKELVEAGATIVGSRPSKSPSLADYPQCDAEVKSLADELWGDGATVKERAFGQGKVYCGLSPEEIFAKENIPPDFSAESFIHWIHRRAGETEIYFAANGTPQAREAVCSFRVEGKSPEFWSPETGSIERAASFEQSGGVTRIPIRFEPSGSVFVVFRPIAEILDSVASLSRDSQPILPAPQKKANIKIEKAVYGVLSDPQRTRDVRSKLQAVVDGGELNFTVARMAEGDDPAFGIVKTLIVDYSIDGKSCQVSGEDPQEISLAAGADMERIADVYRGADGRLLIEAWQPGLYELKTALGRTIRQEIKTLPPPFEIAGPWEVSFAPNLGAPNKLTFDKLISWTESGDPGVKYFSGAATYSKTFDVPSNLFAKDRRLHLDLGKVQVIAKAKLNGHDLGILWKPPFIVDVTDRLKTNGNMLEIKVVNLWPNRMIGDEQLPEDSERNSNGTLKNWPQWIQDGKPSPTGRITFTTWRLWPKDAPLLESGLIGPVTLRSSEKIRIR